MQILASCNGGPGLTSREIAERLMIPDAIVRNTLAGLVFAENEVTCDRDGRYKIGDPTKLLVIA
jgi:DNA-binding IclR family transcriptional regulator